MKTILHYTIAFALLLTPNPVRSQQDEGEINGIKITKYPVSKAIEKMKSPTPPSIQSSTWSKDTDTSHLQYIVGLDQGGAVVPTTGISFADPEYAATLSSGIFVEKNIPQKNFFGFTIGTTKTVEQTINRCHGGGWSMFDRDSKEWVKDEGTKKATLSNTGAEFLTKISENDQKCSLTFKWNEQMTIATIDGYFDSLVGDFFGAGLDGAMDVKIELQPYWQWKFGIPLNNGQLEQEVAQLDELCCPAKEETSKSCFGPNTLGKKGPCETISTACGKVQEENLEKCAMYKRKNYLLGWSQRPLAKFGMKEYLVYPLVDKNGRPTPYNQFYVDAIQRKGIENLFHGVKRVKAGEVNDEL